MPYRYGRKWSRARNVRKYLEDSYLSRSWLARTLLILTGVIWCIAAYVTAVNHQPVGTTIGLPILLTLTALIIIGLDYARDAMQRAVYLDGVEVRREHSLEHEQKRELHQHGVNPEKVEQRLKHGQSFHLNGDGEIVENTVQKAKHIEQKGRHHDNS